MFLFFFYTRPPMPCPFRHLLRALSRLGGRACYETIVPVIFFGALMMNRKVNWILAGAAFFLLAFYPKLFGIYFTNVFVTFAIFAVYAVSFNMLLGYTGLLSFGHAMFFGFGGYGTALALKHIPGLPLLPAVGIGLWRPQVLALLLSPIMVRISGTAFAMLHLAFGQLMYILALKLRTVTGGEDGIGGFPIPSFTIPGVIVREYEISGKFLIILPWS